MKNIFEKKIPFLLSLTALAFVSNPVSAQVETPALSPQYDSIKSPTTNTEPSLSEETLTPIDADLESVQLENLSPEESTLGGGATSADVLFESPEINSTTEDNRETSDPNLVQRDIRPGRTTRAGRSYLGIGGNIGLGGDTALGELSFAINGKIGLTRTLSVRPAAIIGDDTVFIIPVTYDFDLRREEPVEFEPVRYAPFVGGGVIISTDEDDNLGVALTGGIDVPLSREFVANAAVNVGFIGDETEVGLLIGVGYTFPNLDR